MRADINVPVHCCGYATAINSSPVVTTAQISSQRIWRNLMWTPPSRQMGYSCSRNTVLSRDGHAEEPAPSRPRRSDTRNGRSSPPAEPPGDHGGFGQVYGSPTL